MKAWLKHILCLILLLFSVVCLYAASGGSFEVFESGETADHEAIYIRGDTNTSDDWKRAKEMLHGKLLTFVCNYGAPNCAVATPGAYYSYHPSDAHYYNCDEYTVTGEGKAFEACLTYIKAY